MLGLQKKSLKGYYRFLQIDKRMFIKRLKAFSVIPEFRMVHPGSILGAKNIYCSQVKLEGQMSGSFKLDTCTGQRGTIQDLHPEMLFQPSDFINEQMVKVQIW